MKNRLIRKPERLLTGAVCAVCFIASALAPGNIWAEMPDASLPHSGVNTMLMFVGEDAQTLSIASKKEEGAWQAPAVTGVVTRDTINRFGYQNLSELLDKRPGMHMAPTESGHSLYMRGIKDSALILFDTVPTGSVLSKSVNRFDYGLSLHAVKKVEIVRGPGSVLWGPDAFAGIVNVVPLTGKDAPGVETGYRFNSQYTRHSAYVNYGVDAGVWDFFASVSAAETFGYDKSYNVISFWGEDGRATPVEERYGAATSDQKKEIEAYLRFDYGDAFSLTGRMVGVENPYIVEDSTGDYTWQESQQVPSGFLKMEMTRHLNFDTAIRFSGYYSHMSVDQQVINASNDQTEQIGYAEVVIDQSLFAGAGVATAGVSYRHTDVTSAPVMEGDLERYIIDTNLYLVPGLTGSDFESKLGSIFGQYKHTIGPVDLTAGIRHDQHDIYESRTSFSGGAVFSPTDNWVAKLLYGTAYRTPIARQLVEEEEARLESIENLNLQVSWLPTEQMTLSVCGFLSRVEDHVIEDHNAGLSEYNNQEIYGGEFELEFRPVSGLSFKADITALNTSGDPEVYMFNDYTYVRPDGTIEPHYIPLAFPYDAGPRLYGGITADWQVSDGLSTSIRYKYTGSSHQINPSYKVYEPVKDYHLLNASITLHDLLGTGAELQIIGQNITDNDYMVPGANRPIRGDSANFSILLKKAW